MIKRFIHFITTDLWKVNESNLPKSRYFLINQLRIFILAIRGFNEDDVLIRASALTYYTLISIVPVIALAFGIAKGFGFEEMLNAQIQSYFGHQEEVSKMLIDFSHSFLNNTKGGVIAGVGVVMLLWSVIKVLTSVELSFNAIWGITKPRTMIRKFTEYLSIMLIAPVFIIVSGGFTAFLSSATNNVLSNHHFFFQIGSFLQFLINLIPYILLWFLFTFIYVAIPNTKVDFKHALMGGIIAGSIFQVTEWIYFYFQIGVVQYNAVYGSFAAFPLFLIWLQLSWIVVLFGCEIAFASQNVKQYVFEHEVNTISNHQKKKIALIILLTINKNFKKGNAAYTVNALGEKLNLPVRLVQNIMNELMEIGLIMEAYTEELKLIGYTPARELNGLTVSEVIKLLETKGSSDVAVENNEDWGIVSNVVDEFMINNDGSDINKRIGEISV